MSESPLSPARAVSEQYDVEHEALRVCEALDLRGGKMTVMCALNEAYQSGWVAAKAAAPADGGLSPARVKDAIRGLMDDYEGPEIPLMWRAGYLQGLDAALDAVLGALAAPAAGEGKDGWQPIATAPKDGRTVMLWWRGEYGPDVVDFYATGAYRRFGDSSEGWVGESFHATVDGYWTRLVGTNPTHWQPLPEAPHAD